MMKIIDSYPCRESRYSKVANSRKYIVIHNTASKATAKQEAQNCHNNHAESSFHYVLDGNEIYSSVPTRYTAWSVGAWKNCAAYVTNGESISIEVCSDCVEFTEAEIAQLNELVVFLMQTYNIPKSRVIRHYDCHSGHKRCPYAYCGSSANDAMWKSLHAKITSVQKSGTYRYVPVQIYTSNQKDAQKWQIIADSDGFCTIVNKKYGQALDCKGGSVEPSTPIGVWIPNNSPSQKWRIEADANGNVAIIGKKSGLALDCKGGSVEPSTPVQLYNPNGSNAQRFRIIPIDSTWNWIVNVKSCLPLEIKGGAKSSK